MDIVAQYKEKIDHFLPDNIAKILAKISVALGSEDNVSIVVGVKKSFYE